MMTYPKMISIQGRINPYQQLKNWRNNEGVFSNAKRIRLLIDDAFDNPAVLVCSSGVLNDGEQVIAGLKYGIEREIPMFGGMAGDDSMIENSYIFSRRDITNNGIAALIFDNNHVEMPSFWPTLSDSQIQFLFLNE